MRVIFEQCEEGGYSASIKEVPGAISQGETIDEASENVLDALNQLADAFAELAADKEAMADIRELEGTIGDGLDDEAFQICPSE